MEAEIKFDNLKNISFKTKLLVFDKLTVDINLGVSFMINYNMKINLKKESLK